MELLADERLERRGVTVYLKRDDLIHPEFPGNKWRKLKYNLVAARDQVRTSLVTFGGAYSNHLRATAAAGRLLGFSTVGLVRGEEHLPLNWSLKYAADQGMRFEYMDRETYRRKHEPEVLSAIRLRHPAAYLIPEGGTNELAVRGCAELPAELTVPTDFVCCPCGTGGTLAGIAAGLPPGTRALGFAVLKGAQFLDDEVHDLHRRTYGRTFENWSIEHGFHFGGFAKVRPALLEFIEDFEQRHGIRLDRIYVAKMMYGLIELVEAGRFPSGSTITAVITGDTGDSAPTPSGDTPA